MRLLPSDIPAPFPSTCGLKARATLAWGKAPGPLPSANRGLKARAKRLIPYKPLIKRHTILRKHRPHLGLKIAPLMMLCLPIDIPHQRRTITQPNRKCRIPALPSEPRKLRSLRLDPLRRRNFHPLHHARNCLRPSQAHRHMHMVGNPAHPHTDILGTVQNRCQIPMQLRPHPLGQRRPAPLHTEDNMHQHNRERLRHPAHANKLRHATLSHLRITAALLLFLLAPTLTFAQTPPPHTLTIRILNARTNKPVLDEKSQRHPPRRRTRRRHPAHRQERSHPRRHRPRDHHPHPLQQVRRLPLPRGALHNYPINTILTTGITTGNLCSHVSPPPRPGELLLFEIPRTAIPTYGHPPASTLPHSDENPNVPGPPPTH